MIDMALLVIMAGCLLAVALAAFAAEPPTQRRPQPPKPEEIQWVVPLTEQPTNVEHKTLLSGSMSKQVGFNVYTPPGYADGRDRHPVIYWLHGIRGHESRFPELAEMLQQAILAGKAPPMIVVFPNGGQCTFYCDSADGNIMTETMVIRELIPHIDANYRTIASRGGRAIEGFSMGGFGALHLAFKYPQMFCSVIAGAASLFDLDRFSSRHGQSYKMLFDSDPELFKANDPFELAVKNAELIRRNLQILLFVGTEDGFLGVDRKFDKHLVELGIPHIFKPMEGFGHERVKLYEILAGEFFQFHARRFRSQAAGGA